MTQDTIGFLLISRNARVLSIKSWSLTGTTNNIWKRLQSQNAFVHVAHGRNFCYRSATSRRRSAAPVTNSCKVGQLCFSIEHDQKYVEYWMLTERQVYVNVCIITS